MFPAFCESCGPETSGQALMNMPEVDVKRYSFLSDALAEAQEVFQFLKGARLEKYAQKFIELGFSRKEDVKNMSESDLDLCGVLPGHKNRFLSQKHKFFQPHHSEPSPPSASKEGKVLNHSCHSRITVLRRKPHAFRVQS